MASAFWNVYARSYDNLAKHFRPYQDLVQEVCDHVDEYADGRSLRILDAGCGTGNYSLELARRGHTVVGVDNSESMLARAQKKSSGVENLTFVQHDLTQPLPFEDGEFEGVVSTMVLYALPDPPPTLAELRRITKPHGNLVLVSSAKTTVVWSSVRQVVTSNRPLSALRTLTSLASVGILNLFIDTSHATGGYATTSATAMHDLLADSGWRAIDERLTYVAETGILVVARAIDQT